MDQHSISRRSLVVGLCAAIPATTVAALPALAGADPIFAAIGTHKAAWDAYGDAISASSDIEEVLFDRGLRGSGVPKGAVVGHKRKLAYIEEDGGIMKGGRCRFEPTDEMEPIVAYSHEEVDRHFDCLPCPPAGPDRVASDRARCHAELDAHVAAIEAGERELGWPEADQRKDAAGDASWDAWQALLATQPTTLAGLLALVNYAAHHDEGDGHREDVLAAVAASLETCARATT